MKKITGIPLIYVKPGEVYYSHSPEVIATVLGSCVAVVMYSFEKGLCAVSHSVLPTDRHSPTRKDNKDLKFVDHSIRNMLDFFNKNKISRNKIIVKLFGGAEQLGYDKKRRLSIGKQNINKAIEIIEKEGLYISSMDVGGNSGRKIYVFSQNGEVLLSRLGGIKESLERSYA
jgi:chemotaxis protein CheD